jgi:hypothetical protein
MIRLTNNGIPVGVVAVGSFKLVQDEPSCERAMRCECKRLGKASVSFDFRSVSLKILPMLKYLGQETHGPRLFLRSAASSQHRTRQAANELCVARAEDSEKQVPRLISDSCYSRFYQCFSAGCQRRMVQDWRPNNPRTGFTSLSISHASGQCGESRYHKHTNRLVSPSISHISYTLLALVSLHYFLFRHIYSSPSFFLLVFFLLLSSSFFVFFLVSSLLRKTFVSSGPVAFWITSLFFISLLRLTSTAP